MKKIILFILCFSIFLNAYASPVKQTSYQDKVHNYIGEHRYDIKKLIRIEKALETLIKKRKNNIEFQIIAQFFIGEIQKELEYQEKHGYHIHTPEEVRALYYSSYNASRKEKIDEFLSLAKNTEVNALVIDITEIDGLTSFAFSPEGFDEILPKSSYKIENISEIIKKLHDNNIYIIGRIVVFKDNYVTSSYPEYSIKWSYNHDANWTDYKGNSYADPYAQEVWDYTIELASQAYKLGFDEINFDYVRFPTDGYISQTYYPFASEILSEPGTGQKMRVMKEFSKYITKNLKERHPDIILSADIFGLATHTNLYQIGQNIETFVPYFDYVAPMIYPSHYSAGYLGHEVPDNAPYDIFYDSIKKAQERIDALNKSSSGTHIPYSKIRPWLQAFHCSWCPGATSYDRVKFRKQIEALNDLGLDSWYSWNASGRYDASWY